MKEPKDDRIHPPRWALLLLRFICPNHLLETIEGDLVEQLEIDIESEKKPYMECDKICPSGNHNKKWVFNTTKSMGYDT